MKKLLSSKEKLIQLRKKLDIKAKHPDRRFHEELMKFHLGRGYNYAITLNFNFRDSVHRETAIKKLREFYKRLNRLFLGRHWYKHKDKQLPLFASMENPDSNLHFHTIVNLGDNINELTIMRIKLLWDKLIPQGQCDIKEYDGEEKFYTYILKGKSKQKLLEDTFLF